MGAFQHLRTKKAVPYLNPLLSNCCYASLTRRPGERANEWLKTAREERCPVDTEKVSMGHRRGFHGTRGIRSAPFRALFLSFAERLS